MSSKPSLELVEIAHRVLDTCRNLNRSAQPTPLTPEQIVDVERLASMAYRMSHYPVSVPPNTSVFHGKARCKHEFRPTWNGGFCSNCHGWFTY